MQNVRNVIFMMTRVYFGDDCLSVTVHAPELGFGFLNCFLFKNWFFESILDDFIVFILKIKRNLKNNIFFLI